MIINQRFCFAFIHIPKTAGTSVTDYLSNLNGPFDLEIGGTEFGESVQPAYEKRYNLRKHSKYTDAKQTIESANFCQDFFIFSFVRNPLSRLASAFSFLKQWRDYEPDLRKEIDKMSTFSEFVSSEIFIHCDGPDGIFMPQVRWLEEGGKLSNHVKVFKIEKLTTAVSEIRFQLSKRGADLSLLPETIPHLNASESASRPASELTEEQKIKIRLRYSEDFEQFSYAPTGKES